MSKCNRAYKNKFIFNRKGHIKSISNHQVVLQSPESIQIEVYKHLYKKYSGKDFNE